MSMQTDGGSDADTSDVATQSPATSEGGFTTHRTMRYMTRFGCIGPDCEDHCCYGWRVDVDPDTRRRLQAAAQFSAKPAARDLLAAIEVVAPKTKRERPRYVIKHGEDHRCPMLDERNLCNIHKHFGHAMLPNVCAIYPRKYKQIGPDVELTATASCPEVARQLLLHEDAVDVVGLDVDALGRYTIHTGADTRDIRPYFRLFLEVRAFMMELLALEDHTIEERLFLMTWFAKRTASVLKKAFGGDPDPAPVRREMAMLRDGRLRTEIVKRYAEVETPAALALMVVRAICRPNPRGTRDNWNRLAREVLDSYGRLREIVPDTDDVGAHDRAARDASERVMMTFGETWDAYRERARRVRALAGDRVAQYLRNYTVHTWFHRMATETEDVMQYALRVLAQQAVTKFMLLGHPALVERLDALEGVPDDEARPAFIETLDRVAVSVYYQLARHIEHGTIIDYLLELLRQAQLHSLAGAMYLIRL